MPRWQYGNELRSDCRKVALEIDSIIAIGNGAGLHRSEMLWPFLAHDCIHCIAAAGLKTPNRSSGSGPAIARVDKLSFNPTHWPTTAARFIAVVDGAAPQ